MKSYAHLVITLLSLNAGQVLAQQPAIRTITIEWEDLNTQTFVPVSCEDFQSSFNGTTKQTSFSDTRRLAQYKRQLSKFSSINGERNIDVRGKIYLSLEGETQQYCFDRFGHFYQQRGPMNNKRLWRLILKQIKDN